jgi:DNA-binding MarR family transcriptional regulator
MTQEIFEQAIADFAQAIGQLVRRVRAAAASHELSLTEASVMARLAQKGPATAAELARS